MFFSPPDSSVHGFLRQEYWSGLPFPSPGNLPDPGIEPRSLNCGQILYHLSHQRSSLRLNELLGWNTHPIGLASSWSETPETSLFCLCAFSSVSLPQPPPCVRTHGEASLGRKNSYQNLTFLAPWSETCNPQNCEEINFCWLFHWVYCILCWHSWLTNTKSFILEIYPKKMRKLKKLLHFLGIFEISQNGSFFWFPHLMSWWLLWPRDCVIWSLAHEAFLLKGQYSSVTYVKVPTGSLAGYSQWDHKSQTWLSN